MVRPAHACARCAHLLGSSGTKLDERRDVAAVPTDDAGPVARYCPEFADSEYLVLTASGHVMPPMCRRNSCPFCGPWKVRRIIDAIHIAAPEGLLTITWLPSDPRDALASVQRYRRTARTAGLRAWEWLFCLEAHVSGRLHVHAWIHGGAPHSSEHWATAARQTGLGDVNLTEVWHHGNLGYPFKAMFSEAGHTEHLRINSGRLFRASRGFWRDPSGRVASGGYLGLLADARAPWSGT